MRRVVVCALPSLHARSAASASMGAVSASLHRAPVLAPRRYCASGPPKDKPTPTASASSSSTGSGAEGQGAKVDAEAREQIKIAQEIGEENFEANTKILKQVATRGLRSFLVAAVGLGAFGFAIKRRRMQLEKEKEEAAARSEGDGKGDTGADDDDVVAERAVLALIRSGDQKRADDPTERYLEEMRGLGFDVDTLEEELENERKMAKKAKH